MHVQRALHMAVGVVFFSVFTVIFGLCPLGRRVPELLVVVGLRCTLNPRRWLT